jgi:multiple sugar transport system ATP-binding protein
MSVYENMAFALKLRKLPKPTIDEKVRRAAKILGIEMLLERKPKALSGGQRQRVAVGRAIVRDPACFLFDEPLSNLDAKLRVEMRAEIKQLHMSLNATTIYVTHDPEEAMTLGDRVVVMKDGVIQQSASALDVYHHPENRFVASFLGSPPMNFFGGRIVRDGDQLAFDEGTGKLPVPPWAKAALDAYVEQDLVLGVRPEAMADQAHARFATGDNVLRMRVTLVQPLGDRMDVYLATERLPHSVARSRRTRTSPPARRSRSTSSPRGSTSSSLASWASASPRTRVTGRRPPSPIGPETQPESPLSGGVARRHDTRAAVV